MTLPVEFDGRRCLLCKKFSIKTKKIVYIGNVVDDDHYDTIIAPETEFEFVEDIDEFTSVWKCGAQPFYDES